MSEQFLWLFIVIGIGIIVFLLAYIKKQYLSLNKLKEEQKALEEKAASKQESLRLDVVESLKVIAMVMLDDQVELSEGCIRIKVLLDNLDPELNKQDQFKVFAEVTEKLAHMPTHEARREVDKKFIRKLDKQRFQIEESHRDEIRSAAKSLLTWLDRPFKVVE